MGVLPLQFESGQNAATLGLDGTEQFSIGGISEGLSPLKALKVTAVHPAGKTTEFSVVARLDSQMEIAYYTHEGILQYVLRQFLGA